MRGIPSLITDIRKNVFTEVARMAYSGKGYEGVDELPYTFREFRPYLGECRYTKCTHTKEEGCAVLAAIENGKAEKSRHETSTFQHCFYYLSSSLRERT